MKNEMWETENFIVANGMSELGNPLKTYDASPFDYFDGGLDEDIDMDFSDATGRNPRPRRNQKRSTRIEPQRRRSAIGSVSRMSSTRKNLSSGNFKPTPRNNYSNRRNQRSQNSSVERTLPQLPSPSIEIETKTSTMTPKMKNALYIGGTAIAIVLGYVLIKKFKK